MMDIKKAKYIITISLCVILLILFQGNKLISVTRKNIANVAVHKSFSQVNLSTTQRQNALTIAAVTLGIDQSATKVQTVRTPMIPASLKGLYYFQLNDWENAAYWYGVAAEGDSAPEQKNWRLISPWMELTSTGNFILKGSAPAWHFRADTAPGVKSFLTENDTLQVSCTGIEGDQKRAVLEWNQGFDIPNHHNILARVKAEKGTVLIVETVIDGQLIRQRVHKGTGTWEELEIQLVGDQVKYIYLLVGEDGDSLSKSCFLEFNEIEFLLDN